MCQHLVGVAGALSAPPELGLRSPFSLPCCRDALHCPEEPVEGRVTTQPYARPSWSPGAWEPLWQVWDGLLKNCNIFLLRWDLFHDLQVQRPVAGLPQGSFLTCGWGGLTLGCPWAVIPHPQSPELTAKMAPAAVKLSGQAAPCLPAAKSCWWSGGSRWHASLASCC